MREVQPENDADEPVPPSASSPRPFMGDAIARAMQQMRERLACVQEARRTAFLGARRDRNRFRDLLDGSRACAIRDCPQARRNNDG